MDTSEAERLLEILAEKDKHIFVEYSYPNCKVMVLHTTITDFIPKLQEALNQFFDEQVDKAGKGGDGV